MDVVSSKARQVHIVQNTPGWFIWRNKGVGASDVAAIFGESPYKTRRDLWFEKQGLGTPDDEDRSYIFHRGHESEAQFRELFAKHFNEVFEPTCFEKDDIFLASLDGYHKSHGVLEAKLVGKNILQKARLGSIPRHHWIQIQSQLFSSDSDKAWWGGTAPKVKDGLVVEIGRDESFIKKLRSEVLNFWESLTTSQPPPLTERDTLFVNDPQQIAVIRKLKTLRRQKTLVEMAYAELEAQVKAMSGHSRVRCENVTITSAERQGSIDYAKVPEIKALSEEYLESFRKNPTTYKMIRFGKEE